MIYIINSDLMAGCSILSCLTLDSPTRGTQPQKSNTVKVRTIDALLNQIEEVGQFQSVQEINDD